MDNIKPYIVDNDKPIIIGIIGTEGAGKDTLADHLVAEYGFLKYSMAQPIKEIARIMFGWSDELLNGRTKDQIDPVTGIKPREFFKWFGTDIAQHEIHSKFHGLLIPPREMWVHSMRQFVTAQINNVPFTLNYKPTPGGLKHSGTSRAGEPARIESEAGSPASLSVPRHSEAQPEEWAYNRVSTVQPETRRISISSETKPFHSTLRAIRNNPVRIIIPDIRFLHEARAIRELGGILVHLTTPNSQQQVSQYDIPTLTDPATNWLHCTFNNPRISIPDFHSKIDGWLSNLFQTEPAPSVEEDIIEYEDDELTTARPEDQHEYTSNLSIYI
jgi:hypothetical protein